MKVRISMRQMDSKQNSSQGREEEDRRKTQRIREEANGGESGKCKKEDMCDV